jgi:hypothetical protein
LDVISDTNTTQSEVQKAKSFLNEDLKQVITYYQENLDGGLSLINNIWN